MATAVATTTITTVHITWTRAAKIRMTAKVDMPEYGLTAGQIFYLVRSSADDGTYYIDTWDYEKKQWNCPCKHSVERPNARPCRHRRLVSADCKARRDAKRTASSQLHQEIDTYLAEEREAKERKEAAIHEAARAGVQEIEQRLRRAGLMRR